ncbi:MAG: tRNA (guanosine(37)-N1)-methyltransferase TrmD [Acidobacteria bacterium]|nr:MAG: tRNA (guanosine(37)-N1)-methyltransferase TrmD [Acidobacteriota bacterium]
MIVDVVTIFPQMIEPALAEGVIGRARAKGLVDVKARDLRDYTSDKHRVVDDVAFGGGPGMVMKPEPIFRAVEEIDRERGRDAGKPEGETTARAVVLMTPQGRQFSQAEAVRFSRMERLIVLCGRYEGVDERVAETLVTDEISIGDYVLTGGELPALVVIDAVVRLVPGVVGDKESVANDSFAEDAGLLDFPHYTRPADFRGLKVPDVLLSGHHKEIERWRREQQRLRTEKRRPDLLGRK